MWLSPSHSSRRAAGALLAAAALLAANDARAQVPCMPAAAVNPLVTRTGIAVRPQNLNPTGINFADCEADAVLHFSLSLTGFCSEVHLEAWVGSTDCTPLAARTVTTGTCWPASPTAIPSAQTTSVDIRAQDIVGNVAVSPKPVVYSPATEAACHVGSSGPTALSIYFIWLDGGGNPVGTAGKYDLKAALLGPGAPANVIAGQGDTALIVTWNNARDSNTQGYTVYCDPPRGQEGIDAGATAVADASPRTFLVCQDGGFADGGLDDSGDARPPIALDGGCVLENVVGGPSGSADVCRGPDGTEMANPSSVIVSGGGTTTVDEAGVAMSTGGTQRVVDPKFICAQLGGSTTTSATITGLQNDQLYTVAVAASDGFGNTGPLSVPSCAAPTLIDDFWKKYRSSGGQAGGGFCALEGAGMPVGSAVFALGGLVAMLSLVRRRMTK